jgi:hypothetical protein
MSGPMRVQRAPPADRVPERTQVRVLYVPGHLLSALFVAAMCSI